VTSTSGAILASPPPAADSSNNFFDPALLRGPTARFTWLPGSQSSQYWLDVGTTPGGSDLYAASQGLALSRTVTNVPMNGRPLYVRLWSLVPGGWTYFDYRYRTVEVALNLLPLDPPQGAVLTQRDTTFRWEPVSRAIHYWLDVGTTFGGTDVFSASQGTNTFARVGGLPIDGRRLYFRVWALRETVTIFCSTRDWWSHDYSYLTADRSRMATLTSPVEAAPVSGGAVRFDWTRPASASDVWIDIGSAPGTSNLYSASQGTSTSASISGLPSGGQPLFVRVWTALSGRWDFLDYVFQTF
jgi:hypothetical protein